jgi:hypothetical protein
MDMEKDNHSLDEVKILLKKSIALGEENNRMIRSLRNAGRFQALVRVLYLVIFIGGFVWAYYFLQPYLEGFQNTYSSFQNIFPSNMPR